MTILVATLILSTTLSLGALASPIIKIVAAENFYGNVAEQIGGDEVSVTSIMSDPNVNPREYESSVEDAKAVAAAGLVIENGGGFDGWMDRLLSAFASTSRIVLKAFNLAVKKLPGNGHVWYSVDNIQAVAVALSPSLQKLLPQSTEVFLRNDRVFQESPEPIREKMTVISSRYAGTPIGLTETIYLYQAVPLGLRVLTPFAFQKAIAEGIVPPTATTAETENQVRQQQIRILICNDQSISTVTIKAQAEARAANIAAVGLTETVPPGETYQTSTLRQLDELRSALIFAGS
jgi:zinc/manganese transport system substrate-binding protein